MSEQMKDRGERSEGAIGDLELQAEQAERVKGGIDPINGKPAEPPSGKGGPPIKG